VTRLEAQVEAVRDAVAPALAALGLRCYDVELHGAGSARTLRITIERDDRGSVDLETITAATQAVSPLLDAEPSLPGPFMLEVSSPGVERSLRRPSHFEGALGETVTVKYHTQQGPRRVRGTLVEAGDTSCVVESGGTREPIPFADITQARTVFEWGPPPRPGKAGARRAAAKERT
jgi:ribosome maturation factor RimP